MKFLSRALLLVAALFACRASAEAAGVTLTVTTNGTYTGAVGTSVGVCNPPGNGTCVFSNIPVGTLIRVAANNPPSAGLLHGGTGDASGCGTSTCTFTITVDSSITGSFNPGVYPSVQIALAGVGKGTVYHDNNTCQNFELGISFCTLYYVAGSLVTLDVPSQPGNIFMSFSGGTAEAVSCSTTPCTFQIQNNSTVTANFAALSTIAVQPNAASIAVGHTQMFSATGTFTNSATRPLTAGPGQWTSAISMGAARYGLAAGVLTQRIYTIGGVLAGAPSRKVEVYDPVLEGWTTNRPGTSTPIALMGQAREGLAAAVVGTDLYALGGHTTGGSAIATVESYNPTTNTWTSGGSLSTARAGLAAAAIGTDLYAVGGGEATALNTLEVSTPPSTAWILKAPMPTPRRGLAAVVVSGLLYAIGGGNESSGALSTVEVYDPAANSWTTRAPMPIPEGVVTAGVIDGLIYVVAGNTNVTNVQVYNPVTNSWATLASLPSFRTELALAALDGRLFAVGGLIGVPPTTPVSTHEVFRPSETTWWSSHSAVASIDGSSGFVPIATGVSAGTTTISAISGAMSCAASSQCATLTVSGALDDLVANFGAFGVWFKDGTTGAWTQLHTLTAKNIVMGDLDGNGIDEVIVDFGSPYGIWVWANNSSWSQLHTSTATRMVTGDLDGNGQAEILIDFPGFGIWVRLNNSSWFQLHPANATNMLTADLDGNGKREAIIDFPGAGLWVWANNSLWVQLSPLNTRLMTAGDFDGNGQTDLVVDFSGYGIWGFGNASVWTQLHTLDASHLAAGDLDGNGESDLIVDFGSTYGIWKLADGSGWAQLHTLTSTSMVTADLDSNGKADLIVNFGAAGLWEYANNTSWTQLHSASPGSMAVGHLNP